MRISRDPAASLEDEVQDGADGEHQADRDRVAERPLAAPACARSSCRRSSRSAWARRGSRPRPRSSCTCSFWLMATSRERLRLERQVDAEDVLEERAEAVDLLLDRGARGPGRRAGSGAPRRRRRGRSIRRARIGERLGRALELDHLARQLVDPARDRRRCRRRPRPRSRRCRSRARRRPGGSRRRRGRGSP